MAYQYNQFLFSLNPQLTMLQGNCNIGSSGAVTVTQGNGILSIVRQSVGAYQINLGDFYNRFLGMQAWFDAPVTGASINISDGSVLTSGQVYQIVTVGTSTTANWVAVGLPVGVVPAVGVAFAATVTGSGTGTGTVKAIGSSGIGQVELMGDPNLTINNNNQNPYLIIQTMSVVSAGTVAAPTFTGSALGTHVHDLLLKDAAVVDGATTRVNAGANLLGANTGSNITVTGGGANGGVVAKSAGTPAGTNSAPAFTGSAAALTIADPASGSKMGFNLWFRKSSLKGKGE